MFWQPSLLAGEQPQVDPSFGGGERLWLDDASWIDHQPRWLAGADAVFDHLAATLPWSGRVVRRYDRLVPEPRLTWWWSATSGEPLPLPVLEEARQALGHRYGVRFGSLGANFYRDGRDSVAWHADRDTPAVVAIVAVGAPRPFLVRPRGGGPSRRFLLGHGDLLVMGGACQDRWEHAVPKVAAAGPRISLVYRSHDPAGVPG